MKTIKDLIDKHKGQKALMICAGPSIKNFKEEIENYIKKNNYFTIGINNMTDFFVPDYHLWTNTQRFRTYGKNIRKGSILLLGSGIPLKAIQQIIGDRKYTLINYTGLLKNRRPVKYEKGKIFGYYRTAGTLAIMVLHLMGASQIDIVGMDGYSKNDYRDLESGKKSQHCYGSGFTDTADWETAIKKDQDIKFSLQSLKNYGIDFRILTPTMYSEFSGGFK